MKGHHEYKVCLTWTGNSGEGTANYKGYQRSYEIASEGKITLLGSADTLFRGDRSKWNPEELLVSTISSCHMLWYLHLCSDHGIILDSYHDNPKGIMEIQGDSSGQFIEVTLYPKVKLRNPDHQDKAISLHKDAHRFCFIANSMNFPIQIDPSIEF